jgi:ribonuclease HII
MLKSVFKEGVTEVGCDEAGRGCMAGPVVAAAVILDPENPVEGLNDSKQLSPRKRESLAVEIKQKAKAYHISFINPDVIDEINILNAAIKAMHEALNNIEIPFEHILVDGNRFHSYKDKPHTCIVKGDGKFQCIAAASILAKTARDEFMSELHNGFPEYGWDKNKGYATKKHIDAMVQYGTTPHHRKSFHLHRQLKIEF